MKDGQSGPPGPPNVFEGKKRPEVVDIAIGRRVKDYRQRRKMSQEKLGEHLGITFQQIQKYERGTNRITVGRLFEMSRALDVPPEEFFAGLASPQDGGRGFSGAEGSAYLTEPADPDEAELALAFRRIDNRSVRRKVLELVRSIAASEPDADGTAPGRPE